MIRKVLIASLLMCAVALAQPPQGGDGNHQGQGFGGPHGKFEQHGHQPGDEMHRIFPPGRWWKNAQVVKAIGLDDGQVQKIETIFQDSRMKLVDIHATLAKEEIKLEPLLEADSPDENAVLAAIDHIAAARADLGKANARMAFAIRRVLTPEQWKKLRDRRSHFDRDRFPPPGPAFGGKRGEFPHHGHPAPPPPRPEAGAPPAGENASEPSK
jgi:Spy/CpxP family protein refolding chaperone